MIWTVKDTIKSYRETIEKIKKEEGYSNPLFKINSIGNERTFSVGRVKELEEVLDLAENGLLL